MSTEAPVPAIPTDAPLPAVPNESAMPEGLEDFDPLKDAVMPTVRIEHKEGVFVDALSGEKFGELECVVLGLIKQRVLWEPEVEENSKGPLCRSYDHNSGLPVVDRFPWKAAGFPEPTTDDQPQLPCSDCTLKEWGSHPSRDIPWCSEQYSLAILQSFEGGWMPAVLTLQRSALKPTNTYMSSFARSATPLFTVLTKIILDARKRGAVDYAVPKFVRLDATAQDEWPQFAQQYRQIREFLQTPRVRVDDDGSVTPEAVVGEAAPSATDDDELPF